MGKCDTSPIALRTYPPHFGLRLVKLFPRLIETRSAPPEIPAEISAMATQRFFDSLDWESDTWEDGNMVSVLAYARGNRSLNLGSWRPCFPSELWSDQKGLIPWARVGYTHCRYVLLKFNFNLMYVEIQLLWPNRAWLRHCTMGKRVCSLGFFPGLSQWNQFSWGNLSKKGPHHKIRSFSQICYTFDMFQQCFNMFFVILSTGPMI